MDWKLIFGLSLFGLAMAIGTVFVIPSNIEPIFWLAIFLVCAFLIARKRPDRRFLHGLLVGIVNSIWITTVHIIFFSQYMANQSPERGSNDGFHAASGLAAFNDGVRGADCWHNLRCHHRSLGLCSRKAREAASQAAGLVAMDRSPALSQSA